MADFVQLNSPHDIVLYVKPEAVTHVIGHDQYVDVFFGSEKVTVKEPIGAVLQALKREMPG